MTIGVREPGAASPPASLSGLAGAEARARVDRRPGQASDAGAATPPATSPLRGEERWAVVMVAVATALLPLLKPGGPSNLAPVDAPIAVALLAALLWAGSTRQRLRLPYLVPLGLTLVGGAIGALVGPIPLTGGIALLQDLWLASWCWAFFNVSRTARNLRILLSTWVYAAIAWGLVLMVGMILSAPTLTGVNARDGSRVQLTLGDPSYAANYFFIAIMLICATQRPRRRSARYAACAMFLIGMAFTGSNSGLVSLLVGCTVVMVAGAWRRFGAPGAVATLAVVLLAGGFIAKDFNLSSVQNKAASSHYAFIRDGLGRRTSVNQRSQLLTESMKLYKDGSVFGEGPSSTKYRLTQSLATFDKQAHDDYLGALVERGFIGFLGVLLLASCVVLRAGGAVRQRLRNGYETVVVRPHALLGAAVGTLVAATVYGLMHNRHVWTLFAVVAAVSFWGRGHE